MSYNTEQLSFENSDTQTDNQSVVCLGMTFENDKKRREYFREELRKKLSELKKIEGFPIGSDEDIIALSDPPYYTACPNPWLSDFIKMWENEKKDRYENNLNEREYHREPLAIDVSVGKNDPIYNAHYYHTKVPYKAIRKYILHYTNPGDIVLDGFSGSGMTGVAAQMCEYYDPESDSDEQENILLGVRNSILSDLSPNATFMGKNNNMIGKIHEVSDIIEKIIGKVGKKNAHLIETLHVGWKRGVSDPKDRVNKPITTNKKGIINYTVWSDVFLCANCNEEIVYWDLVFNGPGQPVKKELICPNCGAIQNKNKLTRAYEKKLIKNSKKIIDVAKQKPVLINYTFNGKRFEKHPDEEDLNKISFNRKP
ncbi:DNA methyltransferase [Neobacillus sp. Marseille-QA0830]